MSLPKAARLLPAASAAALWLAGGTPALTDKGLEGGSMKKWYAGANWWANRRIRVSAGYGRATLDKLGTTGHTNQYFTRVQWVY